MDLGGNGARESSFSGRTGNFSSRRVASEANTFASVSQSQAVLPFWKPSLKRARSGKTAQREKKRRLLWSLLNLVVVRIRLPERNIYIIRIVDVVYPTGVIDDVSVKRYPKSVSDFLFLGLRYVRTGPLSSSLASTSQLNFVNTFAVVYTVRSQLNVESF
jgi:hypothetical protein